MTKFFYGIDSLDLAPSSIKKSQIFDFQCILVLTLVERHNCQCFNPTFSQFLALTVRRTQCLNIEQVLFRIPIFFTHFVFSTQNLKCIDRTGPSSFSAF